MAHVCPSCPAPAELRTDEPLTRRQPYGLVEHGWDWHDVVREFLVGGSQPDAAMVGRGFQERGADGLFQVVGLACEDSFSGAEVLGALVEVLVPGDREKPPDTVLGSAAGEDGSDS